MQPTSRSDAELSGLPDEYTVLLREVKDQIAAARYRAATVLNTHMLALYHRIGQMITDRERELGWGNQVINQLSLDLRITEPGKGWSTRNLRYMRQLAQTWPAPDPAMLQHSVATLTTTVPWGLPWGHVITLLDRLDTDELREFYGRRAIEEGWTRNVLIDRIKSQLHVREGAALTTFARVVPAAQREALQRLTRDPYVLDFVTLAPGARERDLEKAIVHNLSRFLTELGSGMAYLGEQYRLVVGGESFFLDLLFYSIKARRYVVFELKVDRFRPEHLGQLGFYLEAVDATLREPDHDLPTVGVLLVADHDEVVVTYALRSVNVPVAVSRYTYTALPEELRDQLPTEQDLTHAITETLHANHPTDDDTENEGN
jgi:predicted nuclease of restriction endonuclease-like (RecB) superfamily